MRKKVLLDKKIGETPLEALTGWKVAHPRYKDVPASYAGRLDPMASGKLLILLGGECKKQKQYTGLDKVYDIEVLLDMGSDTGDILGLVDTNQTQTLPTREQITQALSREIGTQILPYPVYSSKTVAGKPLFLYALEGTLDTIAIPEHEETFYKIRYQGSYTLTTKELEARITSLLELAPKSDEPSKALGADFRIEQVRASWKRALPEEGIFCVLKLEVTCGSGAYMRTLAGRIGKNLGTTGLALSIHRTKIMRRSRLSVPFLSK